MLNFRQFEAGPDPFGRKFQVFLKYIMTAISIRHSDSVDVKFILQDENGDRTEKLIALPHSFLLQVSKDTGRKLDDPWCGGLAELHLRHLIKTGEDMEKHMVTMTLEEMQLYARSLATQMV